MNDNEEKKMNVIPINVPKDIEYISEWTDFEYPLGHLILDKTICGCGFTEYCLNNPIPTVLCSPRRALLKNKEKQHNSPDREDWIREVYYFRNEGEEGIEFDSSITSEGCSTTDEDLSAEKISNKSVKKLVNNEDRQKYLGAIKSKLRDYLLTTNIDNPFKIIVTYDSLHHVLEVFKELEIINFVVVVDEFQSIFLDSSFKPDVELDFVEDLKQCQNVLYLSATPMLEKYLVDLDYFCDLRFFKFIWDSERVESVRVERRIVQNMNKELGKYINNYRNGIFPNKILSDKTLKESKELVIFVNSIKSICDIIRKCKLTPEETNIICAENDDNLEKLRKVGHGFGTIPTKGEKHKMFTLCTRTSYLGADFYSTSAYTIVCSDCNIKTLTVDISLDLPQIIGRQRLKENVFRNEVLFLYKARTKQDASINITEEEFLKEQNNKDKKTREMLAGYKLMSADQKKYWAEKAADAKNLYKNDFLGISKRTGEVTYNYLVKISNQRAYDVTRKEYQDNITIKRGIEDISSVNVQYCEDGVTINDLDTIYNYFISEFNKDNNFERRMKLLCDIYFQYPSFYTQYSMILQIQVPIKYQNYINQLGFEGIRSCGYYESSILTNISNKELSILDLFTVGSKYTTKQIKEMLTDFYTTNSITKTPKASDLNEYYILKSIKLKVGDKWENGFEIIAIKS